MKLYNEDIRDDLEKVITQIKLYKPNWYDLSFKGFFDECVKYINLDDEEIEQFKKSDILVDLLSMWCHERTLAEEPFLLK